MSRQDKPEVNYAGLDIPVKGWLGDSGRVILVPVNYYINDHLVHSGFIPQFVVVENMVEHNASEQRPETVAK